MTTANPELHALAAMVVSLEERGWAIEAVDVAKMEVAASASMANEPGRRAGLVFSVIAGGTVVGAPTPGTYVPEDMEDDMERWIGFLTNVYARHSCATDAALRTKTAHFGIEL